MTNFRPQGFQILPLVVKNLLIINGLLFLATVVLQSSYNIRLVDILGLHFFTSSEFRPYQLVTHMFMHGSLMHIFSNMFSLWMFGSVLENHWGPKRFLTFYFVCGLGGAFLHLGVTWFEYSRMQDAINAYLINPGIPEFATLSARYDHLLNMNAIDQFINQWKQQPLNPDFISQSGEMASSFLRILADIPIVGASGAVFGVLLGFGMLFPNTYLYLLFPPIPIKAKYFVIFYGLFELYAGFSGTQSGIAHFAHIGGMLFGFILIRLWNKSNRKDFF
ncbi:MAG: rhomboid family intramembrane serine protease [Chitinophagales bacterium]|nr:rhomboid family intramembrane serine protease [Chitinophagaceae bacterium]MBP9882986.1 rhomboid family intramembrane serine protease [Chitinophagales bacterium]